MSDDLQQKIAELLSKYDEIDAGATKLINEAEVQTVTLYTPIGGQMPNFFDDDSYDPVDISSTTYKLKSPNLETSKLQRQIVQQYDLWCTEAEILIKSYLPEKIDEFSTLKNGNSIKYGIKSTLQFSKVYENRPDKQDIIRDFNFEFDTQKNILLGLARTIHLLPSKKIEHYSSTPMTRYAKSGPTIYNINTQTQTQTTNFTMTMQKFDELRSIIQNCNEKEELKKDLLLQVDELEKSKGTSEYGNSVQKFMDFAANSVTVITALKPFFPFLFGALQS